MRKGILKINGELITGKWIGPSGAARINGLSVHYNKCMDNFSITNHPDYRLLTFYGKELRIICFTNANKDTSPEGYTVIHGYELVDMGIAKNEKGHTVPV